jgi:diacylglycerol O-acyltransferase
MSALEPVHGRDAVWLQDSPTNLMVINSVLSTDKLDVARFKRVFRERILEEDGGRRYPRFKLRVVRQGGRYFWQEDERFDLDRHIVVVDDPALRTKEGLQDYMGRQASLPLPDDRPRWQVQVVPDFGDGGSALFVRVHHVMGDGISMVPVIFHLVDTADGSSPFDEQVKTRGTAGKLWKVHTLASLIGGPFLAARAVERADRSLYHGPELSGVKKVAWTRPLDLEEVKALKNRAGATVNDILMACIAGAFRTYAERHPVAKLGRLRVSMPVNIRPPEEEPRMENKFAAVMFDLPVELADAPSRLAETKRRMNKLKRSVEPMIYYGAIRVLVGLLPFRASQLLVDFYAQKCTAVLSNVPGPQKTLLLAGSRLRSMLFWVPQRANIGLGISILSFGGEVRVGVFADQRILEDPAELVAEIESEFARFQQLFP